MSRVAVTLSDLCCCLYNSIGLPPAPSTLTTLGKENLSKKSRSGMNPPPEFAASAVASLELGNESSPVPVASPLDNVENSPLDDIVTHRLDFTVS